MDDFDAIFKKLSPSELKEYAELENKTLFFKEKMINKYWTTINLNL